MALQTARRTKGVEHARKLTPADEALYRQALTAIVRKFMRMRGVLSHLEEESDVIVQMWNELGIPVAIPVAPPLAARRSAKPEPRPRVTDLRWKEMAEHGIGRVRIGTAAKGKVPVSIDGAKEFTLLRAAADLLAVFLQGEDRDEEGLAPFRSYHELAAAYSARRGHPAGVRAVVMGISRLRKQLMTAGHVSPQLVETMKNRGARLRIRRGPH
jgi:hypothetical protein